ncbi:MAG: hypothetical protein JRI55_12910 [Deltaproteobacteria bacterium]|jgi:hypothetical protein|nr:hypothetical protein [Deltaproteobacteria bacterium]
MKKLILLLCLGLATPAFVGCGLAKQSNRTHHAIEDKSYDVDRVVVQVKDGKKTVIVYMNRKVTDEDKKVIRKIAREQVPDAQAVQIRQPGKPVASGGK